MSKVDELIAYLESEGYTVLRTEIHDVRLDLTRVTRSVTAAEERSFQTEMLRAVQQDLNNTNKE